MGTINKNLFGVLFLYCSCVSAITHLVTNTNDSGIGSLRQAILDANADGTTPRRIHFAIGSGVQTIQPLTQLPSLTVPQIIIDGSTQPGWSPGNPVIVLDGTHAGFSFDGLTIQTTDNCTIQDMVINNGFNSGITIVENANNHAIYGCFVGTDQTGTSASPNSIGLTMSASVGSQNNNTIIGAPNRGNVFSGNAGFFGAAFFLSGNLHNTVIQGNMIGTDKTGMVAVPNAAAGIAVITQPSSNLVLCDGLIIGGPNPGEGNVISGNGPGAFNPVPGIFTGFQNVVNTIIKGNKIGVDITGQNALPNDVGMVTFTDNITTINNTVIGGSQAGEGNVISANRGDALALQISVNNSVIQGNYIGTNDAGTIALSNGGGGINLTGNGNVIGGSNPGEGNVISANIGSGISLNASGNGVLESGSSNNVIEGNFIGTDATGTLNLGNDYVGISIGGNLNFPCCNNRIGGTALSEKNVIKYNNNFGVLVSGDVTTPSVLNPILGNTIFDNADRGIFLGNNGNNFQEEPTIISADYCVQNNLIIIQATAPLNPATSFFRLEFFANSVDHSPLTEGELFIGAVSAVPSGGTITQVFPLVGFGVGQWISATATNLNNTGNTPGDTSEFTPNVQIQAAIAPSVTLAALPTTVSAGNPSTLTATIIGTGPFDLVWSDGFVQTGVSSPIARIVNPLVTTTYFVTATNSFGCSGVSNNETITVNPLPFGTLSASPLSTVSGGMVTLTATPFGDGPFTLVWSDGLIQTNVTGRIIRDVIVTVPTTYGITITDVHGGSYGPVDVFISIGKMSPLVEAIASKYCSLA